MKTPRLPLTPSPRGAPRALAWAALLSVLAPSTPASASPWTLGAGKLMLSSGMNYQFARNEFLDRGGAQPFSLAGAYRGYSLTVGARIGFTDWLELEVQLPFSAVTYQSDPVLLLDGGASSTLDFYQDNVISLSRSTVGVGDLILATRARLTDRGPGAIALEVRVKAPTGYDRPAGTFGDRPTSREEFLADLPRFVRPENVRDDVTLGDGQLDLAAQLHAGYAFSSGTFVRASAGYNRRFGGAGDQVLGSLRAGQRLSARWLLYAGIQAAYSVTAGRVIGISVAAQDPRLPAREYGGLTNLLLREVRLDRDVAEVGGGAILKLAPGMEANLGVQTAIWGRNISQVSSVALTMAWLFDAK
jgi:hypothetical protein